MSGAPVKRIALLLLVASLFVTAGLALAQSSASFTLPWYVMAGGGRTLPSSSPSYRVQGTVGQAASGPPLLASSSYRVSSGFWTGAQLRSGPPLWITYLPVVQRQ
jgi:hypothetical protein